MTLLKFTLQRSSLKFHQSDVQTRGSFSKVLLQLGAGPVHQAARELCGFQWSVSLNSPWGLQQRMTWSCKFSSAIELPGVETGGE